MLISASSVSFACGAACACAALLYLQARRAWRDDIMRLGGNAHFSHIVVHGGTAYLSGVTAQADGKSLAADDSVEEQTRRTLAVIEQRLAAAGTATTVAEAAPRSQCLAWGTACTRHTRSP